MFSSTVIGITKPCGRVCVCVSVGVGVCVCGCYVMLCVFVSVIFILQLDIVMGFPTTVYIFKPFVEGCGFVNIIDIETIITYLFCLVVYIHNSLSKCML